jgi:hypothetical protein
MNGRWLMRRDMSFNAHNASAMMEEAAKTGPDPGERPSGEKLLSDALTSPGKFPGGRAPVTAILSAEVKLLVGIVDRDGMPAGPVPIAPQTLARLDPEKRGRNLPEQFAELCERACAEVLKRWKEEHDS